jgi:hypothetical protein
MKKKLRVKNLVALSLLCVSKDAEFNVDLENINLP